MTQPDQSERDAVVLHTLRCIGFSSEERVASAAGISQADALAGLDVLAARRLVSPPEGVFGSWGLTERGRGVDDEWLAAQLDGRQIREATTKDYEAFLVLNPRLLQVCHDWQMRSVGGRNVPNDHGDPDYDAGVVDRLVRVDGSVQPILDSLARRLDRFSIYRVRLTTALERVLAGDQAYFADGLDSYHTVWFQLHEDLLTTLGLERHG